MRVNTIWSVSTTATIAMGMHHRPASVPHAAVGFCLKPLRNALLAICLGLVLAACDSDLKTDTNTNQDTGTGNTGTSESITLQVGNGDISLVEGAEAVSIPVKITRSNGFTGNVQLGVAEQSATNSFLSVGLADSTLSAGEDSTTLSLQMAIGPRAIQPHTRTLSITAGDVSTTVDIAIQPTDKPDVYLLAGQSNMIGFSEDDSRQAFTGGLDARSTQIRQLNVTGNDDQNFSEASDFTTPANLYNIGMPLSVALDPLHDGFDTSIDGKAGNRIGPALSFAKRALLDTTVDIYLVPAAWSDTGFCRRDTNRLPGIGWNASAKSHPSLSGTLLFERAVMRSNIALEETGGILRGILWHQGEADSDDINCATRYADNLAELAAALRSTIQQDARGAGARGAGADIPFIVGTMSRGSDSRGELTPYGEAKQLVDDAHRNIGSLVSLAGFVNNDDLVPPAYPCGEGSCIHFGAAAYREMGNRYYEQLEALLP